MGAENVVKGEFGGKKLSPQEHVLARAADLVAAGKNLDGVKAKMIAQYEEAQNALVKIEQGQAAIRSAYAEVRAMADALGVVLPDPQAKAEAPKA